MSEVFTVGAVERLKKFLENDDRPSDIEILTPDASTREYFRVNWNDSTAIACVYPESFLSKEQTYLDVTNLFLQNGLPVAKIFDFSESLGVIVLEDFGNLILRDRLSEVGFDEKEHLLDRAIVLIAEIQAATTKAFELDSIASRLAFDEEKLGWELNFFKTHYFETLKKQPLTSADDRLLNEEFAELARELAGKARVLCHRDFHAANLMLDRENRLRIIDHQDARIGAASYDLVSLLLDRILEIPEENRLAAKKRFFLAQREKLDLKAIDFDEFEYEFRLQTVQRCLKAIGTFSFQTANRGKTNYVRYINPMFRAVSDAATKLNRFPTLQKIIAKIN